MGPMLDLSATQLFEEFRWLVFAERTDGSWRLEIHNKDAKADSPDVCTFDDNAGWEDEHANNYTSQAVPLEDVQRLARKLGAGRIAFRASLERNDDAYNPYCYAKTTLHFDAPVRVTVDGRAVY